MKVSVTVDKVTSTLQTTVSLMNCDLEVRNLGLAQQYIELLSYLGGRKPGARCLWKFEITFL